MSACPDGTEGFPTWTDDPEEPGYVAPECASCEHFCCDTKTDCTSLCWETTVVYMILYLGLLCWFIWKLKEFRRVGKAWSSTQIRVFSLLTLMVVLRFARTFMMSFFNEYWQKPSLTVVDHWAYWHPIGILLYSYFALLHGWAGLLSRFEGDGQTFFTTTRKLLVPFAIAIFISQTVAPILIVIEGPIFLYILLSNGVLGTTTIFISVAVLRTAREVSTTLKNAPVSIGAGNDGKSPENEMVKRFNRMATIATYMTLITLISMGFFSFVLIANAVTFPGFCEFIFTFFRTLEFIYIGVLTYPLRGLGVGSSTQQ